jgi:hypothetical protein
MLRKKIACSLLLLFFVLALASPVLAAPKGDKLKKASSLLPDKPLGSPGKPSRSTASITIRNIASGDTLYSEVLIIAQATGTFDSVVYQIDSGSEKPMTRVDSTDRYQATWTIAESAEPHTLTVKSLKGGIVAASSSTSVTVVTDYQWEVYYEIDYINGHVPSTNVLEYMVDYWKGHAIKVTYKIDEEVSDPTQGDDYISDSDFWTLENTYNDGPDNSGFGYKYTLKDKWMLYGSWDASSNVGGYTYVAVSGKDLIGGNYIFIADGMINNWESQNSIPSNGGKVIVTCHEAGHSIGIAVLRGGFEKYDADAYSVMSYMRLQNAKDMAGSWYYSKEYWATANLSYYQIV